MGRNNKLTCSEIATRHQTATDVRAALDAVRAACGPVILPVFALVISRAIVRRLAAGAALHRLLIAYGTLVLLFQSHFVKPSLSKVTILSPNVN